MVLPDTPERKGPASYRLPALSAVAVVSVIMVLVLGRFTSPPTPIDPAEAVVSVPDPTTTTPLREPEIDEPIVEQGRPLSWRTLAVIGNHRPLGVFELQGEALVFTTPPGTPLGHMGQIPIDDPSEQGGLFLWSSQPETEVLTSARVIPPGMLFHTVESTSFGVLALGVEVGSGLPTAWTSNSGREWRRLDLFDDSGHPLNVYEVYARDGATFLLASTHLDGGWEVARRTAVEQYGEAAQSMSRLTRNRYGVFGALGLFLGVITDDHAVHNVDSRSYVLRTDDGANWEITDMEELIGRVGVAMGNLVTSPAGEIWGLVYGFDGPVVYQYHGEGPGWGRLPDRSLTNPGGVYFHLMSARTWSRGHLALSRDAQGNPTLVVSNDLEEWSPLFDFGTFVDLSSGHLWTFETWDTGPHDIAMVAQRVQLGIGPPPEEPVGTLHKDGFDLEVTMHWVRLSGPGVDIQASRYYSFRHSGISFDAGDNSVIFLDGAGVELVRFGQAELAAVDVPTTPNTATMPLILVQAFLHSTDGETWTVQDISALAGGAWASNAAVIGDRVYLVTDSSPGDRAQPGNVQGRILTARVP